jgi:phosphohistidine swiveling domain-containing protein
VATETERWIIDTDLDPDFPVYTRFNANDVLPDPITPLGSSLAWNDYIFPGFTLGYVEHGALTYEEATRSAAWGFGAMVYGHLYVNVTMARLNGIRSGLGWEAIDAAFFGSHPDAPTHTPLPRDDNPDAAAAIAERTTWTLTTSEYPELVEDALIADAQRAQRPNLETLTNAALVARARSMMPLVRLTMRGELIAGAQSAVGPAVVGQILAAADPEGELGLTPVDLIGPAGEVVSAQPTYLLWDISRIVRNDADLSSAFDAGLEGIAERVAQHAAFNEKLAEFMLRFGYRGPSEWDLGAPAWESRPELVFALIDAMRAMPDSDNPEDRRAAQMANAETAVARVRERLAGNDEAIGTLELGLSSARRFAGWREEGKSNPIKLLHEAHMALREFGMRLEADGYLQRWDDIFMALDSELDVLVYTPGALTEVLAERRRQWAALGDLEIPLFLDAEVPVPPMSSLPRKAQAAAELASVGEVLQGQSASPGTARGRARVVTDPGQITAFEPGDILIAPQTDPSWTPLFLVSAGVVVDVGAMNSHAMIVSRELGIPCTAGVEGATRRIPDGATVEVNGSAGTVTVIDLP